MFAMGVPLGPAPLFACVLAALLLPRAGWSLEIQQISLDGGAEKFMEVGAKVPYVLNCDFRTPYDDPVKEVMWTRYGKPFYKWMANGNPTVLDANFLGMLDTDPPKDPHNLHFKPPLHYQLGGNYDCYVYTAAASVNASYYLRVIDADSGPYNVSVESLGKIKKEEAEANSTSDGASAQNQYQVSPSDDDSDTDVSFANEDCTLVWSLSTPPIYPRPNVTCGHYSFDHQDVVQRLPAGLTLHKYPNGSWTASFYRTHVQVASLPKNHRLGCSIRIPNTTYKKVVRAPDDLWVESLIDTGGCPGLLDIQEGGVIVDITDGSYTCRGDVLPADRTGRALASLSCPDGHRAMFAENQKGSWNGGLELSCVENDLGWRHYYPDNPTRLGDLVDPTTLPVCVPGVSGAEALAGSVWSLTLAVTLALGWLVRP